MMKNPTGYFEKLIRVLKELKEEHPNIEVSKHYSLATSEHGGFPTDKELFLALQKYQSELSMNTLSDRDFEKILDDTDSLFSEIDPEDEDEDIKEDYYEE